MTKSQFIKKLEEFGYTKEDIQDLLDFHEESGIPFDMLAMPLIERIDN